MCNPIFNTPYDRQDAMNGEPLTILQRLSRGTENELLLVQFNNGAKIEVWPEEIEELCPKPHP